MCPGWMLGVVKGQVEAGGGDATTGWDFADVFPGGAANWGGAFLPFRESKHPKEAAELADWLTQPEQQVQAVRGGGQLPVHRRGAGAARSRRDAERVLQRRPDRRDPRRAREGRRRPVQGPG